MALNGTESEYFSPYRSDGKLFGFVCVVTGADGPIGQAIVAELAAHGAACIYACSPSTSSPPNNLPKQHPNTQVISYPYTITSESDTLALIDEALNTYGRLDVWVTSSGLLGPPSIADTTPSDLQKCFEANSLAPFFALKYAPAAMTKTTPTNQKLNYPNAAPKDQTYGSIIVVTSTASTYGGCWGPCFTMTSHAALGVVRSGVPVLKGSGIRINAISPGSIDLGSINLGDLRGMNDQLPPSRLQSEETHRANIGLERTGRTEEVARVAGFLASGFSSYVTGANMVVDGGASVMCPLMVPM
ncbi:putative 3-oxoacyl-(acyl-carrier-protein) reductase [Phaeomoniella chlamydospora]|uniref:Peroxisomal trans-2-enoyl-CoA reductase n=1 Tax=Phaeomoniella chlamydospora TaxID=158046 RepID=A0A0G2HD92_PHACM|nr:putative 3-oxoacyl-(acyl-carrier-protein) reductase [Phaeomoniella chlamydospora]